MVYRTFDQWSSMGYKIIKGSKATWFDGVAKFSEKQVVVRPRRSSKRWPSWMYHDMYSDMDDPWEDVARDAAWGFD